MGKAKQLTNDEAATLIGVIDSDDDAVRSALHAALAQVVGLPPDSDWATLVISAAVVANWTEMRREMLLLGDRTYFEDLLLELHHARTLEKKEASAGSIPTLDARASAPVVRQVEVKLTGDDQKDAVSAMELAIRSVGMREPNAVRSALRQAEQLDRAQHFSYAAPLLDLIADELERDEDPSESLINRLVDALGAGPLSALVELVARAEAVDPDDQL